MSYLGSQPIGFLLIDHGQSKLSAGHKAPTSAKLIVSTILVFCLGSASVIPAWGLTSTNKGLSHSADNLGSENASDLTSSGSPGSPESCQSKTLIAAGQIRPASPIPSGTPSSSSMTSMPLTGTSASPSQSIEPPINLIPPPNQSGKDSSSKDKSDAASEASHQATSQAASQPTSAPDKQNPSVVGNIEYNANQPQSSIDGLSILQALDEALTKGPRGAAIRSQLQISKSGIAQAAQAPNPVFFMDRGFVAEAVERRGPISTFDPPWKLAFRMMAANRFFQQTKVDLMTNLWQLRADTRRAYTEAVIAQESEKTLSQLYELNRRLWEVSSKRFQAGDVPELDVLRARLATSQSKVDLGVGQQRVVRAKQQLNVILGRVVEQKVGIPRLPDFVGPKKVISLKAFRHGVLPDFSRDIPALSYFLDLGLKNRLELKSLAMQVKVNDMNYKNAVASIVPNPSLAYGSSTNSNLPSGPKLKSNFMTLNVELPFSNMNQGDREKYKAMGVQLKYQIEAQKNMVQGDVSSAYNNLLAAREKIRVYQEHVLDDSNEVARLARRSYEVGQSDINATLLAQQSNIQVQMQYLEAITSFQGAYTDLEQACGLPLE